MNMISGDRTLAAGTESETPTGRRNAEIEVINNADFELALTNSPHLAVTQALASRSDQIPAVSSGRFNKCLSHYRALNRK